MSTDDLSSLLRQVSEAPNREIEKLINQLQDLRTQLQNAGNRIERDIAEYAELNHRSWEMIAVIEMKNL